MHRYEIQLDWTGNRGSGTSGYRDYDRSHDIRADGKPVIAGSADPAFRGDADRWSPEDLLVAALSQCHLLWYLHLAADSSIVVTGYSDHAYGTMRLNADGSGQFTEVVLRPRVLVASAGMVAPAQRLHERVHSLCFIARSVNFPVRPEPMTRVAEVVG
ncbi:MAG: OsmC family protein [Jatrophihabitantaceae bacterium]